MALSGLPHWQDVPLSDEEDVESSGSQGLQQRQSTQLLLFIFLAQRHRQAEQKESREKGFLRKAFSFFIFLPNSNKLGFGT